MAEADQNDKNPSTSHRRPYYQNRPAYPGRGRGRQNNVSVNKAMHLFGVRDLREILDRKHQDEDYNQAKGGPPPDPSYNYLRDPSRDSGSEQHTHRYHKEHHSGRGSGEQHSGRSSGEQHSGRSSGEQHSGRGTNDHQAKPHSFRGSGRGRGRGGAVPKENRNPESEKARFIQNPVNIKVELVASTGERNCKIDEETKLADIKHIPNYKLKDLRPNKSENAEGKIYSDRYKHERGRGRWQRGGRGRGRGGRGRGRGGERQQVKRNNDNAEMLKETNTEPSQEENWDNDSYLTHFENPAESEDVKEDEVSNENDDAEGLEEHDEEPEQYYEEGSPESLDVIEQNEGSAGGNITIEENLVITASEEEVRKRTVTFKLEDGKDGATGEESKPKEKEKLVEGGDDKNEQSETTSNN